MRRKAPALLRARRPNRLLLPCLVSWPFFALLVAASFQYSLRVDSQPQGRYLLPSLPGIALVAAAGAGAWPGRAGRWGPIALAAAVLGLNLYARLVVLP